MAAKLEAPAVITVVWQFVQSFLLSSFLFFVWRHTEDTVQVGRSWVRHRLDTPLPHVEDG